MRRPDVRELAARVRQVPSLVAIVVAFAVGVALLATSTLIPVGAVLVLGSTAAILFAIIQAAQS